MSIYSIKSVVFINRYQVVIKMVIFSLRECGRWATKVVRVTALIQNKGSYKKSRRVASPRKWVRSYLSRPCDRSHLNTWDPFSSDFCRATKVVRLTVP